MIDDFNYRPPKPRRTAAKVPDGPLYVRPELRTPPPTNDLDDIEVINEADEEAATLPVPHRRWSLRLDPRQWSKRRVIVTVCLVALLVAGAGALGYSRYFRSQPVVARQVTKPPVKPPAPLIVSPLTGLPVTAAQAKLPVTGVMIENSLEARPQSGLDQAGVVYEAVAEAGITRFLALYQEGMPSYIGPVRSVRPYFLDWLEAYDAAIAHVGGSPQGMQQIQTDGIKNLDQFYNGSSYTRISSRAAPHNVYTSLARLQQLEQSKGYVSSTFTSWPRKADAKTAQPTAASIDFAISSADYNVHYDYDAAGNRYLRSEGGKPHLQIDAAGHQTQITPKVVIAMVINKSLAADRLHTIYGTIGSGNAFIFQDGTVTKASWSKADRKSQIIFKDSNGQPVKLNAGQTWITAVSSAGDVTYK